METNDELFKHLEDETKVLKDPRVHLAFREIDRADFVGEDYKVEAYEDYALPIGFDQTISQPTTVAFMLELLGASEGDNVLDIGSGSGWTSALLAKIVGENGYVTALEIIPELYESGVKNVKKYSLKNLKQILSKQKVIGIPGKMFDRILVSASSDELPPDILLQLNDGGVLVIPIKNSIWRINKTLDGAIESKEYPGFSFVPLK